jgi:hypothetical protein
MEFTKINETTYLVPMDWAIGIKCSKFSNKGNEYILKLPNNILRSIKVDIVNNSDSLLSEWYEGLKNEPVDLFVFIDYDNITLLKNLRRCGHEIFFDNCINGKIDYISDTLYRIEYNYGTLNIEKLYFIEESDFSSKYPKLLNILKLNNDNPFDF